jgi:pimeloyl-ACP methyl ester carboxylesterase/class 3 adenylate cyclase
MQKKKISIVAGDMVGFSRLIEEDEINTLKRQKIIIKDIIDPKLGENNGKLIKTTGDGFLAVFENCDQSLSFGIEIQNQIINQEKIIIPEKKIWYRIGINYGEIILENDDIYGNEVNIASRVESICEPGGISITSSVKENLKTDNMKLENIGYQVLKNIKKPVEVYQLNLKDKNLDLDLTESDQEIRYCLSQDHTTIAYAKFGSGPPLIKAPNFMTSLEHDWRSPIWKHYFNFFGSSHSFYRFDQRGNGFSDWKPQNISFDNFVDDLDAVVNDAKLENFPLFALSQGTAVSLAYAAKYPRKVSKLIILGGYARGRAFRMKADEFQKISSMDEAMILNGWEQENPAFRQFFASSFLPEASKEQMDSFNNIMKFTTSATNAAKILRVNDQINVVETLKKIEIPSLILHAEKDMRVPFAEGEFLAKHLKNSKLVSLPSSNHIILEQEDCWPIVQKEIMEFLKS